MGRLFILIIPNKDLANGLFGPGIQKPGFFMDPSKLVIFDILLYHIICYDV